MLSASSTSPTTSSSMLLVTILPTRPVASYYYIEQNCFDLPPLVIRQQDTSFVNASRELFAPDRRLPVLSRLMVLRATTLRKEAMEFEIQTHRLLCLCTVLVVLRRCSPGTN